MASISENDVLPSQPPPISQVIRQMAPGLDVYTVEDFSVDAFSAVLDFVNSGTCGVLPKTLGGIASAAAVLQLEHLEKTITKQTADVLNASTIFDVIRGLEPYYTRHPVARQLFDTPVAPYVEEHATEVLSSPEFRTLRESTVRLLYNRALSAEETLKFKAAQAWAEAEAARRQKDNTETVKNLLMPLVANLKLHRISTVDLMHIVKPSGAVADERVMMALAYQVDPSAVRGLDGAPTTPKRELLLTLASKASAGVAGLHDRLSTLEENTNEGKTTGV